MENRIRNAITAISKQDLANLLNEENIIINGVVTLHFIVLKEVDFNVEDWKIPSAFKIFKVKIIFQNKRKYTWITENLISRIFVSNIKSNDLYSPYKFEISYVSNNWEFRCHSVYISIHSYTVPKGSDSTNCITREKEYLFALFHITFLKITLMQCYWSFCFWLLV